MEYIGALEAGGTKMVCCVADLDANIIERVSIPTTTPDETFEKMIAFYKQYNIKALGIGCFGPIDLNKESKTYGYITKTPKLAWQNVDMVGTFQRALNIPIGFDTDVNAAILGEVAYGAAKGCSSAIYITIGTGVGVGVYVNGGLLHGLMHPEAGHILMRKHERDSFEGQCPFHKSCLEGLASGPAIEARYHMKAYDLAEDKQVWELEAYYIAQAVTNYILTYSPEKVILWGGVMHQEALFSMIRKNVEDMLAGYLAVEPILHHMDEYVIPPALLENAGIKGACKLALEAYKK